VLDGEAAGVDVVEEAVAVEAGEFLVAGGYGLAVLGGGVGGEQGLDGGDFLRGLEAGEVVRLGACDEGGGALEEVGAAAIEAGADEVAIGGEVGGGVAIGGEHLVFLFGGALDFAQGGVEIGCGLDGGGGGLLGLGAAVAGGAGAGAGLGGGGLEIIQPGGGDVLLLHFRGVVAGGGQHGLGEVEVLELALVEVAAAVGGGGGFRGGSGCGIGGFWHGGLFWVNQAAYKGIRVAVPDFSDF